jgi:hypothetical protein
MKISGTLSVWKFTPVARPAWQGQLHVAAPTSGAAILAAERHYQAACGISSKTSQDRQQARSGFDDLKLYRVNRIESELPLSVDRSVLFENRLRVS